MNTKPFKTSPKVIISNDKKFKGYTDIATNDIPMSVRFHSDDLIFLETYENERFTGRYWSPDDRINVPTEQFQDQSIIGPLQDIRAYDSFHIVVNNVKLKSWTFLDMYETEQTARGARHFCVELLSKEAPVNVTVHTIIDGTPVIMRYLTIKNTGEKAIGIGKLHSFSGTLWRGKEFSMGYFQKSSWSGECWLKWEELGMGRISISHDKGLSFNHPFLILRNEISGEYFAVVNQWSGNCEMVLSRDQNFLSIGVGSKSEAMQRVLLGGEQFDSTFVHLVHTSGTLDKLIQAYHTHLRRFVLPELIPEMAMKIQYLLPADHGFYLPFDETSALECVEVAAEMGAEVFVLDAYWWDYTCCWEPSKTRFPNGINAVRERVREKGMKFSLYLEMEGGRGNIRESPLYKLHPEWFFAEQNILDVSIPEVAEYMEKEISRLIELYDLDIFRLDYNCIEYGDGNFHLVNEIVENNHSKYYENLYRIYRNISKKYPDVLLQQAAAGGARNDLGIAAVFHENYVTDGEHMPRELQVFAGTTLELPPEYLILLHGADGANLSNLKTHKMDTVLRISYALAVPQIFVSMVAPSVNEFSPARKNLFAHYTKIYKEFIRPVLADTIVYHHAPIDYDKGVEDSAWFAMEYGVENKSKGWALIAKMFNGSGDRYVIQLGAEMIYPYGKSNNSFDNSPEYIFLPRGLDIGKHYKITLDSKRSSFVLDGYTLMNAGLRIRLENAGMSELVLFEECQGVAGA